MTKALRGHPLPAPGFDWDSLADLRGYVGKLSTFYEDYLADEDSMVHDPLPWEIVEQLETASWAIEQGDLGLCQGCVETVGYLGSLLEGRQEGLSQGRLIAGTEENDRRRAAEHAAAAHARARRTEKARHRGDKLTAAAAKGPSMRAAMQRLARRKLGQGASDAAVHKLAEKYRGRARRAK